MKQVSPPVAIAVSVLFLAVVGGFLWSRFNDNGERPNPNAGKPTKSANGRGFSRSAADNMDEKALMDKLRETRPDLSEAELKEKADNLIKLRGH